MEYVLSSKFITINKITYFTSILLLAFFVILYGEEKIETTTFIILASFSIWFLFERELKHSDNALHKSNLNCYYKNKILNSIRWNSKLPMLGCCTQIYFGRVFTKHQYNDFTTIETYVLAHRKLFIGFIQLLETGFLLINIISILEFIIYFLKCWQLKKSWNNICFNRDKNDIQNKFYNRLPYNWIQYLFDFNNLKYL